MCHSQSPHKRSFLRHRVQQKNTTPTLATSPQILKHNSQVQKIQFIQQQGGQPQMVKQVILTQAQHELLKRQQQINAAQRVFLTTTTGATPGSQVLSTRNVVMLHAPQELQQLKWL
ncbi:hypothetical protein OS493_004986 [Desmophyllum pertusum]|uniref:Uncharacterized protein n=1 Tax=Desmophyllum pertusum TaxID=174260 RepID=A0A9W9Z408_9CNID|nr:hypothetical protein OS493_004986 [Desmophyllum pertusum]